MSHGSYDGRVSLTLELSTEADITLNGIDPADDSGVGVASGDINKDGGTDLVIGAWMADPVERPDAGETYVLFGPHVASTPVTLELSVDSDITINGIHAGDASGVAVASGDINSDRAEDMIVGATGGDPWERFNAGEIYVILGEPISVSVDIKPGSDSKWFNNDGHVVSTHWRIRHQIGSHSVGLLSWGIGVAERAVVAGRGLDGA